MDGFLLQATLFLFGAVFAVPIAIRLGLGSVLGYLIAGVLLSPVLPLIGVDAIAIQHFAEFGVVMMLFLIGLELEPRALWDMRHRLLGLGGLQVGLTTLAVMAVALALGQPWQISLAVGLILSLSSTAIVLQTLGEKRLMKTDGGQASFSVLLTQDIAVIPMLAFLPLLAMPELMDMAGEVAHGDDHSAGAAGDHGGGDGGGHGEGEGHGMDLNLLAALPGWAQPLVVFGAVGIIIMAGQYLTRPIFRFLSHANLPEIFTAAALLLVIGIALLMTMVGLSPALGTFLAGVVLANSEYRHELEADIGPFKGLLLGLFFITVGAGINFALLFEDFFSIIALTLGLILIKAAILFAIAKAFRLRGSAGWLFTFSLAQAGEFGFVLLSFALSSQVIPAALSSQLLLVVALSMLLTPLLFIIYDRVFAKSIDVTAGDADEIDDAGPIIIAGLGRFGQVVNRMLLSNGYKTVVMDHHNDLISGMRHFGVKGYFGDPSRPELLHAAKIEEAKVLVVAVDDREKSLQMVQHVTREYPHVKIVARAFDRQHTYELYAAGARDIVRETFDSSVRAGRYALIALGMHPFDAEKAARAYTKLDRSQLEELARLWDPEVDIRDNARYVARAREINEDLERALKGMRTPYNDALDRGWMPPPKRGDVRPDQDADQPPQDAKKA
ncbi:MAG: cation:proton antiporter [Pseudomonadota bacterium]